MRKKRLKCTKTKFCDMILDEVVSSFEKGLVMWSYTSLATGKHTRSMIGYKKTKAAGGMLFNFCPFCGGDWTNRFSEKNSKK